MDKEASIQLKEWKSDTGNREPTGESISVSTIAHSMTPENFTRLFDDYLNLGGKSLPEGKNIGLNLHSTHRTLQRLAICFAFGLIVGLSEQEYTDGRNATAIMTAKKVAQMMEAGELPLGPYL